MAAILDGQKWLVPCGADQSASNLVCVNQAAGTSCAQGTSYLARGMINRDDTVTFGGTTGVNYDVTVRIRGVVEPKHYSGGTKDTVNDGWYVGGAPVDAGAYMVYMLDVSDPPQVYYLNAIDHPEVHYSYPVDYVVTLPIAGGASVRFHANDPNCSAVKNCDPTSRETAGGGMPGCYANVFPDAEVPGVAQPYRGQFLEMQVVSVAPSNTAKPPTPTLVVVPDEAAVPILGVVSFRALALQADGSQEDVTAMATWTSSRTDVADLVGIGNGRGISGGTSTIRASFGGALAEGRIEVPGPALTSIVVSPDAPPVAPGVVVQFTAKATYADGRSLDVTRSSATWTSSDPSVSITTYGYAQGVTAGGTSIVRVALGSFSGMTTVAVKAAPLQSIAVTAQPTSVACGANASLTAIGHYADGSTIDLTASAMWTSPTLTIQTYAPSAGVACPSSLVGPQTVTASLAGVSGSTTIAIVATP